MSVVRLPCVERLPKLRARCTMVSGEIIVSTDCNILTNSQEYSKVLRILLARTNNNFA